MQPGISTGSVTEIAMNFDANWQPMTAQESAELWPMLQSAFGDRLGTPERTKLSRQSLSFITDANLIRLRQRRGMGQATRYAVLSGHGQCLPVRFSPSLIGALAGKLSINPDNAADYLEFCWRFAQHGVQAREAVRDESLSITRTDDGRFHVSGFWLELGRRRPLGALIGLDGQVSFLGAGPSGADSAALPQ